MTQSQGGYSAKSRKYKVKMEKVQSQGGEWSTGKVLKTQSQGGNSADSRWI